MRVAAGVEYCGADFYGWQKQPGQRTVQGCVELALSSVADHDVEVQCAGRTDAGVHAVQQVIHFDTLSQRQPHSWILGVNSNLPKDVRMTWVKPVEQEFHARFSATARKYKYLLINRPVATALYHRLLSWEYHHLDEAKMSVAATDLIGQHDFTSFRAASCQAKSPLRTLRQLDILRVGDLIIFEVQANAFLQHMVRNIVGVLMMVGMGKQPVSWVREVLEARDRTVGGVTAPPHGLYLVNIEYDTRFAIPDANEQPGVASMAKLLQNFENNR
jgi:tRNA pseudouridine38-40 synthase